MVICRATQFQKDNSQNNFKIKQNNNSWYQIALIDFKVSFLMLFNIYSLFILGIKYRRCFCSLARFWFPGEKKWRFLRPFSTISRCFWQNGRNMYSIIWHSHFFSKGKLGNGCFFFYGRHGSCHTKIQKIVSFNRE